MKQESGANEIRTGLRSSCRQMEVRKLRIPAWIRNKLSPGLFNGWIYRHWLSFGWTRDVPNERRDHTWAWDGNSAVLPFHEHLQQSVWVTGWEPMISFLSFARGSPITRNQQPGASVEKVLPYTTGEIPYIASEWRCPLPATAWGICS